MKHTMIRRSTLTVAFTLAGSAILAHDMFLVVDSHQLDPHATAVVRLLNGTFEKSENTIDRDRMSDVSVIDGAGERTHPPATRWRDEGPETLLDFETGNPGTYVVAVSTEPRMIELSPEDFNEYLRHDGVLDVLEAREQDGTLSAGARERYSKHVRIVLQVGETTSDSFRQHLGYPAEIVPLANPASLKAGDTLEVQILTEGRPLPNQLVYASHAGFHGHSDDGAHREAVHTRSGEDGIARIELSHAGRWYVRTIHMVRVDEADADYESSWATLTFEVE